MDGNLITAFATGFLVIVGIAQIGILITQRRQSQLELIAEYRRKWIYYRKSWGTIVFIGRDEYEFYQVVDGKTINKLISKTDKANYNTPTIWALDASKSIFTILSDIATKILQNQINISDVYPIFGTELLRHSKPLRILLDNKYQIEKTNINDKHQKVREEIQSWLIYHNGIRRRSLILIDLLWAEAARLEDLPPSDLKSAADAKKTSGKLNKKRLYKECIRLNGVRKIIFAISLSRFLRNAEYRSFGSRIGISKKRLEQFENEWTNRLLNKY